MAMSKARFEAELIQGHKGVTVVIVPFDPEQKWSQKPVRLDPRREGWLIRGTANGVRFDGYIGYRWNRFFIIIERDLREAAKVSVGDVLTMVIEPTLSMRVLVRARAQSKVTTAPKKGRADAIDLEKSNSLLTRIAPAVPPASAKALRPPVRTRDRSGRSGSK